MSIVYCNFFYKIREPQEHQRYIRTINFMVLKYYPRRITLNPGSGPLITLDIHPDKAQISAVMDYLRKPIPNIGYE